MQDIRSLSTEEDDALPSSTELADRVTATRFRNWYREREIRENIQNGTPYFNGPPPVQAPTRHSPSKLLQCHRKVFYQQLNAPEEQENPTGIFWIGSQFEETIALPFLQEAVAGSETYACNTLWVDFEVETETESLRVKGATDPVLVTEQGDPLLVTEIKTTSSVTYLDSPKRHHKAQSHAYMYGLSEKYDRQITDAVILYADRESLDVRCFHVEFDPEFWTEVIHEWAETHTEYRLNDELPPADPAFDWECEFCSFRARCGKADTAHEDVGAVGFLPLYAEYPRRQVIEYVQAHDSARLTPTLAHQYPDLAEEYGAYDWHCPACKETYPWDDVEWKADTDDPPLCAACLSRDDLVPLRGPAPDNQHDRDWREDNE